MTREQALDLRDAIVTASASLPDDTASYVPELFERWETGVQYIVGDRRSYRSKLYKCVQPHTSQSDWTPDVTPALWVVTSADEIPEWVQPTGAHDAYNTGDRVRHNNVIWNSLVDGNVWEPGATGTDNLWEHLIG